MGKDSPVTQKELAEVNKDIEVLIGGIKGLREEMTKKFAEHNNLILDRAKAIGDLGVKVGDLGAKVKALEDYIKKVDKENWI